MPPTAREDAGAAAGPPRQKGCRTCTKRRIRCDLARPACSKCAKKGLDCPGYGPRLRWAGGVAVRGRLKGQNGPLPLPGRATAEPPHGPGPPHRQQPLAPPRSRVEPAAAAAVAAPAPALDLALRRSARRFIDYYDKHIAGLMVWIDSDDNDYRRRVLPLAARTPGLRLAVAAIAAHHGALAPDALAPGVLAPGALAPDAVPRFSETARDACLGLIQQHVRDMTGRLTGGAELTSQADIADAEWMLAAILIISTYEMANAQAAAAESHRMAARTIANVFRHHSDSVFDFLRNQLSVLDVLSSTTSFDPADVEHAVLPPPSKANGLFTHYLTALHSVTRAARRAMLAAPALGPATAAAVSGHGFTASSIRSQFEQARGATLLAAGRLDLQPPVVGRDFIRLVDIYHHAAMLYSYRCLALVASEAGDRAASVLTLFELLAALEAPALCAQNLPWPVFVAGTECHGDAPRQEAVAALFAIMTDATGFRHFLDVLGFLRLFWAGAQPDWQPLARDLQHKGFRILAV